MQQFKVVKYLQNRSDDEGHTVAVLHGHYMAEMLCKVLRDDHRFACEEEPMLDHEAPKWVVEVV